VILTNILLTLIAYLLLVIVIGGKSFRTAFFTPILAPLKFLWDLMTVDLDEKGWPKLIVTPINIARFLLFLMLHISLFLFVIFFIIFLFDVYPSFCETPTVQTSKSIFCLGAPY